MGVGRSLLLLAVGALLHADAAHAQRLGELAARARADSNDELLHYQVAMGYWREKQWDEAEVYLRHAIAVAPQFDRALLALGELPYMRGEKYWKRFEKERGHEAFDSALAVYAEFSRRAFLINPLVDRSILGDVTGGDAVQAGIFTLRSKWIGQMRRGATKLHRGDAAGAYAVLDSAKRNPMFESVQKDVPRPVLYYHGLAAAETKRWDEAIEDFGILTGRGVQLERDGEDLSGLQRFRTNEFRYALATMLYLAGRHDQAAPVFRRVLEIDLGVFPAHVQLARIHEAAGDAEAGIRERQQAVEVFPQNGTLYLELSLAQFRAGRGDEARQTLEDGMKVNPRDYRIPLMLGEMLMAAGRDRDAREPYQRFLAIAPMRLEVQMVEVRNALAQIQ